MPSEGKEVTECTCVMSLGRAWLKVGMAWKLTVLILMMCCTIRHKDQVQETPDTRPVLCLGDPSSGLSDLSCLPCHAKSDSYKLVFWNQLLSPYDPNLGKVILLRWYLGPALMQRGGEYSILALWLS